jgi:predicted translin family RNA/ssDNA-binding protein
MSRDCTIQSKRVIFSLHRLCEDKSDDPKSFVKIEAKLKTVTEILCKIAKELLDEEPARYHRAFTDGIQEFIEALSFFIYLRNDKLISFAETQKWLTFHTENEPKIEPKNEPKIEPDNEPKIEPENEPVKNVEESDKTDDNLIVFPFTAVDYVLGVADLTGEVMRMTIDSIGKGNQSVPFTSLHFIRTIQDCFLFLLPVHKEVNQKLKALNSSVYKIERVCYAIKIRGSENISRQTLSILDFIDHGRHEHDDHDQD